MLTAARAACASVALVAALAAFAPAAAPASPTESVVRAEPDTCWPLEGEGAYSYVKVWNISCERALQVGRRAYRRFCPEGCPREPEEVLRGDVRFNGWDCGLTLGYESVRIRCERPGQRFVRSSGA